MAFDLHVPIETIRKHDYLLATYFLELDAKVDVLAKSRAFAAAAASSSPANVALSAIAAAGNWPKAIACSNNPASSPDSSNDGAPAPSTACSMTWATLSA